MRITNIRYRYSVASITWLLILFSCLFFVQRTSAQTDEKMQQLAQQYFNNGDFEKAAALYLDLYTEQNDNTLYYERLLQAYVQMKQWPDAEKLARKQMKRYPAAKIDLIYVLRNLSKEQDAEKLSNEFLRDLVAEQDLIVDYSRRFGQYEMPAMAMKILEKGNKILGSRQFSLELAGLYLRTQQKENSVRELLEYLEFFPEEEVRVKTFIQKNTDRGYRDILETAFIQKIQDKPERIDYVEFLCWMYIQEKDFASALIQLKALDKRLKLDGREIMSLASDAVEAGMLSDAILCYEYVISKGPGNYYLSARSNLLRTRKRLIEEAISPSAEDVAALKNDYEVLISAFTDKAMMAGSVLELSQLEAFYQNNLPAAIQRLEALLLLPGLRKQDISQAKLQLGDYYLMNGDLYEANLVYGQVDKSEKDSPLGEEARFRNARLSYFRGDYDWSKAQLSILKEATTELIANDALDLGIFLQDNLGVDSVSAPLEMYCRAELLLFQRRYDEALIRFDSLAIVFPGHQLADDVLMSKADIYSRKKNYDKTKDLLFGIVNSYSDGVLADNALFKLAQLHEFQLNDPNKAMELYKEILIKHKASVFGTESRKRFRILRGDKDEYEELFFDGTESGLPSN